MALSMLRQVGLGLLVASLSAQAREPDVDPNSGGPYGGVPATIPGLIQAEKFDLGGEGAAYSDTSSKNWGNDFRPDESVDILSFETASRFRVGWIEKGEYLRYTVNVAHDVEAFNFRIRMSSPNGKGSFRIVSGGSGCDYYTNDISGLVSVPDTGDYDNLMEMKVTGNPNGGLLAGVTQIWLCALTTKFDIDYFYMMEATGISSDDAFAGKPAVVPGTIQAEDFDWGGEGVGYSDSTPTNVRGDYRPDEGVDIVDFSNGNYFRVGWITVGEYMRYTIQVTEDVAAFDFRFRVASSNGRGSFYVVSGDNGCDDYTTNLSGLVTVPKTGGTSDLIDLTVSGKGNGGLPAGLSHIWLCVISTDFDIDYFTMTVDSTLAPVVPAPAPVVPPSAPVVPPLVEEGEPFEGISATVPGTIEAENFDEGGQHVAYYDSTPGNKRNVYRLTEDVDIYSLDDGAYSVAYITVGEFLRYTVDVTQTIESVFFSFRVSSADGLGSFRIVAGGTGCDNFDTDLSGLVAVPNTGGKNRYTDIAVSSQGSGGLLAGPAQLWLCVKSEDFRIDSFTMSKATTS